MPKENMATMIEGAALGPPFQMLFDFVVKIPLEKALMFKDKLRDIKSKLEALDPLIQEIEKSNMVLGRPKSETSDFVQVMKQGKKLVSKCMEVRKWYYAYKWPGCITKLQKLHESLNRLLSILQAEIAVDMKKALVLLTKIEAKTGRAETKNDLVCNQVDVKGQWEVPQGPDFTLGLDKPLKELKMELLRGDRSVIVVTAPCGCGKTTLAKKLCLDAEIKERFKNNIMFVEVSKTPNLNLIVQELYQYNGWKTPSLQEEEEGILIWLERLLKEIGQSPMLLVLDGVRSESESLIEKFSLKIPDYKILVTSRFEFPAFGAAYELETLNDEDAVKLFYHYALLDDGSSSIPDDLVKQVVQQFKKFPLILQLLGSSLSKRPQEIWPIELKRWSRDSFVLDSKAELLLRLQSSLDFLGQQDAISKEFIMDLCSFSEDQRIPATAIVDMRRELLGLEEDDSTRNFFMPRTVTNNIKSTLPKADNDSGEFLKSIEEHFQTTDKSLVGALIGNLASTKFDGSRTLHEHIFEMTSIATKLKTLGVNVDEYLLAYLILNSLPLEQYGPFQIHYNSGKAKWNVKELVDTLFQKETTLKNQRTHSIHLATQQKAGNKSKWNTKKGMKKKQGLHVLNESSKATQIHKKRRKNDKCYFCKKVGHYQKDCLKRKAWFENKGIPYDPNHKVK